MGSLDIGIVGPALPAIQGQFGVGERLVSWIFAIYILFFMIGTPLMAKLSDIYGRRSIYVLDIFIFALEFFQWPVPLSETHFLLKKEEEHWELLDQFGGYLAY
jgi:MFS family permease